ncbi:hypothetical protein FQR65_LT18609 [Abscondita terminalis]|nr:hypothetical protein FQR65_LT18609 [Abscondita terminalis]
MLSNAEYVKETVRGKQILSSSGGKKDTHGMDKENITMWSYGQLETLNLFIPRLMGGASQEEGSDKMTEKLQQLVQENATSQQEVNNYDERWWILGASALTIMLAWGSNFMPLTDFFIDYVPVYNKFRAPSSILVVVELLFPFIAIIGLYRFFTDEKLTDEYKQKVLLYTTGSVVGITLILILFGKTILGFHTALEGQYLPSYLLDYLVGERYSMFRTDAVKAIIYVLITAGVMFMVMKQKLNQNIALIIIGLVAIVQQNLDVYDDLINKYFNGGGDPNVLNMLNTKYVLVADSTGIPAKRKSICLTEGCIGRVDDIILENLQNSSLKENLNLVGYIPHEQSVKEMENADMLLITNFPKQESAGIIPGKIFEYLATQNPILSIGPEKGMYVEKNL